MIGWMKDLPADEIVVEHHQRWPHPAPRGEHGIVVMAKALYERVDEYARSTPTSPSDGRVYRRLHRVDGVPDQPVLFIVATDPDDATGQYHHPHHVHFTDRPPASGTTDRGKG